MNYTEDITSPLDAYRDHFRQDNIDAAEAVLDELIKLAGIDVEGNKSLCGEIHELEKDIKHSGSEWLAVSERSRTLPQHGLPWQKKAPHEAARK